MTQSPPVRTVALRVTVVLLVLLGASGLAAAKDYWFESYERAVELIDDGRVQEAAPLLEEVIRQQPLPKAMYRAPGNRYINYLPYLQRARIEIVRGEFANAAHSLDVSEAFGAVTQYRRLFAALQDLRLEVAAGLTRNDPGYEPPVTLAAETKKTER